MELWDIYNKDRIKTGRTISRGSDFNMGDFHLVVHACIFNSEDKLLIQQRQPFKQGWSNMWDLTMGGSALSGESSQAALERELAEEIGYKADLSGIRPFFTINFPEGFDDYYLIQDDVDIDGLSLQYEEVQAVAWASLSEILQMQKEKTFIPYHTGLLEMIFQIKSCMGAINNSDHSL